MPGLGNMPSPPKQRLRELSACLSAHPFPLWVSIERYFIRLASSLFPRPIARFPGAQQPGLPYALSRPALAVEG